VSLVPIHTFCQNANRNVFTVYQPLTELLPRLACRWSPYTHFANKVINSCTARVAGFSENVSLAKSEVLLCNKGGLHSCTARLIYMYSPLWIPTTRFTHRAITCHRLPGNVLFVDPKISYNFLHTNKNMHFIKYNSRQTLNSYMFRCPGAILRDFF
jgi:hypothetical protein